MSNSVNPPIAQLAAADLTTPQGKQILIELLNQSWIRSGGGNDTLSEVGFSVSAEDSRKFVQLRNLTKKLREIELALESANTEIAQLKQKLKKQDSEEQTLSPELKKLDQRLKNLELQ